MSDQPDARLLVDVMAANDAFKKLTKTEDFKDIMQALISMAIPALPDDWSNEVITVTLASEAGIASARCMLRKEQAVKIINPIVLQGLGK